MKSKYYIQLRIYRIVETFWTTRRSFYAENLIFGSKFQNNFHVWQTKFMFSTRIYIFDKTFE